MITLLVTCRGMCETRSVQQEALVGTLCPRPASCRLCNSRTGLVVESAQTITEAGLENEDSLFCLAHMDRRRRVLLPIAS